MAKDLKELLTRPLPRKDNGQAAIFTIGGGYLMYLAFDMVRAVYAGRSAISLTVAWITACVMAVAGVLVLLYALRLWMSHKRAMDEENARLLAARLAREAAEAEETPETAEEG